MCMKKSVNLYREEMMNKNLIFVLSVCATILAVSVSYKSECNMAKCEKIAPLLVVYDAEIANKPLEFCR